MVSLKFVLFVMVGLVVGGMSNGNPLPTVSDNQSEILTDNLTSLLHIISDAGEKADRAFNFTCGNMTNNCTARKEEALTTGDFPSFADPDTGDVMLLVAIRKILCEYYYLAEQLAESVKQQLVPLGPNSAVYDTINNFTQTNLGSAVFFVKNLVPGHIQTSSPRPSLVTSGDVTNRNARNVRVLARAAHELRRIAVCLRKVIKARKNSSLIVKH